LQNSSTINNFYAFMHKKHHFDKYNYIF